MMKAALTAGNWKKEEKPAAEAKVVIIGETPMCERMK